MNTHTIHTHCVCIHSFLQIFLIVRHQDLSVQRQYYYNKVKVKIKIKLELTAPNVDAD